MVKCPSALPGKSMSETFTLACKKTFVLDEFISAIKRDNLCSTGDNLKDGVRFYIDKTSTRAIDVVTLDEFVEIKIPALAAPGDCALALDMVATVTKLFDAEIDTEYAGTIEFKQLREIFDNSEWLNRSSESGVRSLIHLIDEGRGPMCVPGPVRNVFIGTKVLTQFRNSGKAELMTDLFLDLIRKVQYIAEFSCTASRFTATEPPDDKPISLCIWFGTKTVLPPSDYVILSSKGDTEVIKISMESLVSLCGDRLVPLDESQFIVDDYAASDWTALREQAAKLAV